MMPSSGLGGYWGSDEKALQNIAYIGQEQNRNQYTTFRYVKINTLFEMAKMYSNTIW
jgi:hypothetical protein